MPSGNPEHQIRRESRAKTIITEQPYSQALDVEPSQELLLPNIAAEKTQEEGGAMSARSNSRPRMSKNQRRNVNKLVDEAQELVHSILNEHCTSKTIQK